MADNVPQDLKYTQEHEWARVSGKIVVVGITQHASNTLGDIVYVELPKLGAQVAAGGSFGTVESVKAVSELFAPISGKVVKVNDELVASPEDINSDPYGDGWLVEIELSDAGELGNLLDAAAYEKLIKE
ncbi:MULTISPECIES: glycine cleavage system protein GcvH [unclassified Corallococcus]|uniref:glycine cleavage system protein GcvH n=1 Tax=unclassified Corallococcus TaxID=2685029 RepID=UPI001A9028F8|nr:MULTISPECIES: glycine cleavage system protein GcvH [unclassified Corallococcus]MBN9684355.1 glycine cleavage system protein GcvH [Corallococcus sp. NCSPR001]WAS84167.1 glycine cleavage system protein GcvH [Corallococcus sp. NCRR]